MRAARRFEELEVWQEARELTKLVYRVTRENKFLQDQRLRNQMRDASVSIMSNLAEGFSRRSDKEFRRFIYISKASGSELESHAYVSLDQEYISGEMFRLLYGKTESILRRLSQLAQYLSVSISKQGTPDTRHRTG